MNRPLVDFARQLNEAAQSADLAVLRAKLANNAWCGETLRKAKKVSDEVDMLDGLFLRLQTNDDAKVDTENLRREHSSGVEKIEMLVSEMQSILKMDEDIEAEVALWNERLPKMRERAMMVGVVWPDVKLKPYKGDPWTQREAIAAISKLMMSVEGDIQARESQARLSDEITRLRQELSSSVEPKKSDLSEWLGLLEKMIKSNPEAVKIGLVSWKKAHAWVLGNKEKSQT
jgi:hypothetical protein